MNVLLISLGISLFINFSSLASSSADESVEKNWRTSYDILVRPAQSDSFLDYSGQRLIEPNFLSGQKGGITLDQYKSILTISGIEVAAPISMVGYFPLGYLTFAHPVRDNTTAPWSIYKDVRTITVSNNLKKFQAQDTTYTIHDRRDSFGIDPDIGAGGVLITPDGEKYSIEGVQSPVDITPIKVRVFGKEFCL